MSDIIDPSLWGALSADPLQDGTVLRRILPLLQHDIFIGESRPTRRLGLYMEVKGTSRHPIAAPASTRGLRVRVEEVEGAVKIEMVSTSASGDPLFAELANDVVGVLSANTAADPAARVVARIAAWQAFLASKPDEFGPERAAGLFAELFVLREHLIPSQGEARSVSAWGGPQPARQDFQFGSIGLEVKSFRGTGPGRVVVASEQQLDLTGLTQLFLGYVTLDQREFGTGKTVQDQVELVEAELVDTASALDSFREKLIKCGWHPSVAEVRKEKYEVRECELFRVEQGFPRITGEFLPNGIGNVSYQIDRAAIEDFLVPWLSLHEAVQELS